MLCSADHAALHPGRFPEKTRERIFLAQETPPCTEALYARHTKMWIRDARPFSTASGSERGFPERSVAGASLAPARGTDHVIHILVCRSYSEKNVANTSFSL
jgi:hypothetical protein